MSNATDTVALVADSVTQAAAVAPASKAPDYKVLAGPFEVAGSRADAFISESPSGGRYLETRPKGGATGRVKRVPLEAVAAVFPQILPAAPKGK